VVDRQAENACLAVPVLNPEVLPFS